MRVHSTSLGPREVLRSAVQGALCLALPQSCAGCGVPDEGLCPTCREALRPRVIEREVGGLIVCAGLSFEGCVADTLRACKEAGQAGLLRELAPALAAAGMAALERAPAGPVAVVPVPSSSAAVRRRGRHVVELLAARAGLHPQRLLIASGRARDQRALGAAERADNVAGTLYARPRRAGRGADGTLQGRSVLIVDDVVTTGATLAEARRALEAAGATVVGAATVASTPRTRFATVNDR